MGRDLHELPTRPLQLRKGFRPASLAFEGVSGIERDRRLSSEQLEPAQLLRPKPAGPPPLQANEADEALAGAHRKEHCSLHAGELGAPPGPVRQVMVGRWVGHIGRHLRVG